MEKRLSFYEFQSVKTVAKACSPLVAKREKVQKQIDNLTEKYMKKLEEQLNKLNGEYDVIDTQIKALESGIIQITGFRTEQLVRKVVECGTDSNGKPTKTTKYLPTSIVSYDEEHRQFVINDTPAEEISAQVDAAKQEEPIVPPTTEDGPGSDFDIDKEESYEDNEDFGGEFPSEDDAPDFDYDVNDSNSIFD